MKDAEKDLLPDERIAWRSVCRRVPSSKPAQSTTKSTEANGTRQVDSVYLKVHRAQILEAFRRHGQVAKVARIYQISTATVEQALLEHLQERRTA